MSIWDSVLPSKTKGFKKITLPPISMCFHMTLHITQNYRLLGCHAMHSSINLRTLWRNLLCLHYSWRQHVPPKHWCISMTLQGTTAMSTSNLTCNVTKISLDLGTRLSSVEQGSLSFLSTNKCCNVISVTGVLPVDAHGTVTAME